MNTRTNENTQTTILSLLHSHTKQKKRPFLLLLAMTLCAISGFACGPMEGGRPCTEASDCIDREQCREGLCQPLETAPTPGAPTKPGSQTPTDPTAPTDPVDPKAPTAPKGPTPPQRREPPAPACPGPQVTCLSQGVCQGVVSVCRDGQWQCDYPTTKEDNESLCDGLDNDCDGKTDEGCDCQPGTTQSCGLDRGTCQPGTQQCDHAGKWGACKGSIGPQAEVCDNKDNDCDGSIDEAIERPCYTGPKESAGHGPCKQGKQICEQGEWRRCVGEITPQPEVCDGIDNNCDGQVDEHLSRSCYDGPVGTQGLGSCAGGTQQCQGGQWSQCQGQVLPQTETCDGIDNDCDGQVDEHIQRACYTGPAGTQSVGQCKGGTQLCAGGQWGTCQGEVKPTQETCDGVDNDCDGTIDEGLVRGCYDGPAGTQNIGNCSSGTQLCRAGQWGVCQGQVLPQTEVCDGIDNDCDGSIDENIQRTCYNGPPGTQNVGQCRGGIQWCTSGQWGTCQGEVKPGTEICDGIDNDCDGTIDENLQRACYNGPFGSQGRGICRGGTQQCQGGSWGSCIGQVLPQTETCDGIDNDCDGTIDDGSSICGAGKICRVGRCECDQQKGYYPNGGTCVKDGDNCPAGLSGRSYCATSAHWVVCDPYGKVGILHCPSFSGTQCINVAGGSGCKALPSQYLQRSCMSFTTNYGTNRTWGAIMTGLGPNANNAVIAFEHCVGNGRQYCGYIATSAGSSASCMCGERSLYCSNLGGTVYDVNYANSSGQCQSFWGNQFGCPAPLNGKNACTKTTVNGFATYACGF